MDHDPIPTRPEPGAHPAEFGRYWLARAEATAENLGRHPERVQAEATIAGCYFQLAALVPSVEVVQVTSFDRDGCCSMLGPDAL